MNYQIVKEQKDAANENLARINAPFRLALMSQNKGTRVTVEIGTPEQIAAGLVQNNVLYYASTNEASKFLSGFNACLSALSSFSAPCNQTKKDSLFEAMANICRP